MAYAIIQLGNVIYGAGYTQNGAIADAMRYLDDSDKIIQEWPGKAQAQLGSLYLVSCSHTLMRHVAQHGGDIAYAIDSNGHATLL